MSNTKDAAGKSAWPCRSLGDCPTNLGGSGALPELAGALPSFGAGALPSGASRVAQAPLEPFGQPGLSPGLPWQEKGFR